MGELAAPFAMTQPAVSQHLRVLERAGLVTRSRDGRRRPARLAIQPLAEANAWIERYRERWEQTYRRLDRLLAQMGEAAPDADPSSPTPQADGA